MWLNTQFGSRRGGVCLGFVIDQYIIAGGFGVGADLGAFPEAAQVDPAAANVFVDAGVLDVFGLEADLEAANGWVTAGIFDGHIEFSLDLAGKVAEGGFGVWGEGVGDAAAPGAGSGGIGELAAPAWGQACLPSIWICESKDVAGPACSSQAVGKNADNGLGPDFDDGVNGLGWAASQMGGV